VLPNPVPPTTSLHVLLAEDNHVNQVVALRTLEKLGHSVVVANNGLEALSLLDEQAFDLVLMDIQMPEMDGLTATNTIREGERQGGRRIPIIAMTAHAMKGDRERCLEGGMDGYVSKPISGKALEEAIAGTVQGGTAIGTRSGNPSPGKMGSWDAGQVLAKLGGNEKLFHELLEIFREESPKNLDKLRQAISQGDSETVANIAHSLKGELGYFGISGVCECARELEEMGRRQDLEGASGVSSAMENEILAVLDAMENVNSTGKQSGAEAEAVQ
jgi:CheY-like chemotaxis protein